MPVSRPVPPYLQSPWHPPPTAPHTVTTMVPHPVYQDTVHTYTLQVPVQRLIDVQAERIMRVRRPIKVMVEEEVEEEMEDEPAAAAAAAAQPALKDSRTEEWKEQTADVVLDIAEREEEDEPPPLSSNSLSSLTQPLTFAIPASSSSSSSSPPPSSSYRLRAYNPRIVHGYLERQRPGARRLTTVPADSLPPPPFRPPSYPLSNIPPPVSPAPVFPPLPSASSLSSSASPSLTISIPSSSPPLPALPDPDTADPTNLLSAGLVLRDAVELPRGSPRHLLQGVHIYAVLPNSRAAAAGLQAGDEVISVHGQSVRSAEEMTVRVNRIPGRLQTVIRRDSGELQSVWL